MPPSAVDSILREWIARAQLEKRSGTKMDAAERDFAPRPYLFGALRTHAGTLQVRGRDSADGSEFVLDGEIISQFDAVIDFSPKGGPKRLAARFRLLPGGRPILEFPDGNAWARLSDKPDPNVMAEIERDRIANRPMSADKRSGFAKVMGALSEK